jgi:hypothetical protein
MPQKHKTHNPPHHEPTVSNCHAAPPAPHLHPGASWQPHAYLGTIRRLSPLPKYQVAQESLHAQVKFAGCGVTFPPNLLILGPLGSVGSELHLKGPT